MALSVHSFNNLLTQQQCSSVRFRAYKDHHKRSLVNLRGNYSNLIGRNHNEKSPDEKKLKILIAGGGIGGLVFALAAKRSGFDVKVFEKESSVVRGEGIDRGPIQLLSSALRLLENIDREVAKEIMEAGYMTASGENGIADGTTGEWFFKWDLLSGAVAEGIPATRVICRMELQRLLLNAVGTDTVINNSKVVNLISDAKKVRVFLENGEEHEGDILIGADGIRSRVRSELFGPQNPKYSNFTCYTAMTELHPKYFHNLGVKIFLGTNQSFVALNLGKGRMQWYAFVKEPHQSPVSFKGFKPMLVDRFGDWCDEIITSISRTRENMIIQRPIYDIDVVNTWSKGRVILLGDAAHAMLPNLGQGGTMAIEDCYWLLIELRSLVQTATQISSDELHLAFKRFQKKRTFRVSTVHSISRLASMMTSLYWTYLNIGLIPVIPLSIGSSIRVRNPVLIISSRLLQLALPKFMDWIVLGQE